jgi:hypothetical protein
MDLLAIIQERINAKLTKTGCSVNHGTGCATADKHDASEIEDIETLVEKTPCTTGHDTDDAFPETVLTVARNPPSADIKKECVMSENNQSPNDRLWGTAEAPADVIRPPLPQGLPEVPQQIQPPANVKPVWPPEIQLLINWFLKLDPGSIAPFYLEPHLRIVDPVKFCAALRREIQTGPAGPRAKHGALQEDLWKLKQYFDLNGGSK